MRMGWDTDAVLHRHIARRITTAAREAINSHGIEVLVMEETQGWAGIVARAVDIPVVVTLHGPCWLHRAFQPDKGHDKTGREIREAEGLRHAAAITAPSWDVLEQTRQRWGLPDVPTQVLRNPVPVAPMNSQRADFQKILFVGRFELVKGGDIMLEAFERLARRHSSCRLTFVGPDIGIPKDEGAYLTLGDALSLLPAQVRQRIDVKGQCSRGEIASLRRTHGVAVVASRYENFSGAMVEAMAAGSALVCTRVGGCGEVLSHRKTALLTPAGDPQAIADTCLELLDNPKFAKQLGSAARAHVASHLAPEEIGRQLANFLRPVCRTQDRG
jgi:glycosyltransferase involved in cell wall biosynthesis